MTNIEEQVQRMDEILKFNTKINILCQTPTREEIGSIKRGCKEFKGYQFDTDAPDLDFIKQNAEFGNSFKNFRK